MHPNTAYVWHPASNARNLLELAEKREQNRLLHITNLADQFLQK